jgi:hypothetical protein
VTGRTLNRLVVIGVIAALAGCSGGHEPAPLKTVDLYDLGDAATPFEGVNGAQPRFGGDVNGDGFDDIVVGGAIVVLGRRDFPRRARVRSLDRTFHVDVTAHPVAPGCCVGPPPDELLVPVTALGDLDGDGYDELGIGGRGFDYELSRSYGGGITETATAYVLFGRRAPHSVVLEEAGDAVARVTTGLRSDESASVALARLPGGRLLAVAGQQSRYFDRCGADGHPRPKLTRPLTSILTALRRGARIDLAAGGPDVQRLHVPGRDAIILAAAPLGPGIAVSGEVQNGRDCVALPEFGRVGRPGAFADSAANAPVAPADVANATRNGPLAVGDFDGDGNADLAGSLPANVHDTLDERSTLTLRLGRAPALSPTALPPIAARLGPWTATFGPIAYFAGDLNRDGRDDLVVTDDRRATLVFGTAHPADGAVACRVVGADGIGDANPGTPGDVNGDGAPDLVLPRPGNAGSEARIVFGPIEPTGTLRPGHRVLCTRS